MGRLYVENLATDWNFHFLDLFICLCEWAAYTFSLTLDSLSQHYLLAIQPSPFHNTRTVTA